MQILLSGGEAYQSCRLVGSLKPPNLPCNIPFLESTSQK